MAPVQLEYVSCELCGAQDTKTLFYGRDRQLGVEGVFRVVKCRNCGMIYINPRPVQETILHYYPKEYRGFYRVARERVFVRLRGTVKRLLYEALPSTYKFLSSMRVGEPELCVSREPPGRVLDVGCGEGRTLQRLKQMGWQSYGVELDHKAATYGIETFGLDVFCGQLEDTHFPPCFFDLAIFRHSLEHVPQPLSALRETYRILKHGGEVLIDIPNMRSFQARLFRDRWVYWDVPRHLYNFTDNTLQSMLIEAGFSEVDIKYLPATGGFAASLQYVWNDLTGNPKGRRIWNSGVVRTGLWPLAFLLAKLGYADCIRVRATKATPPESRR